MSWLVLFDDDLCWCSCLQCIIEWQMKKVQTTLGNIMNLDSAAITVNNRLTALRSSHSQRLAVKVPHLIQQVLSAFSPHTGYGAVMRRDSCADCSAI